MLKACNLFHPDSPGVRVRVARGLWGRLLKPRHFATLHECMVAGAWQYGRTGERLPSRGDPVGADVDAQPMRGD